MSAFSGKNRVECTLCAHACMLAEGQRGRCGVRMAKGEEVVSLIYGKVVAENVDPIEKKPIFHVLPGTMSYSIATPGCNFKCLHCQNASISQVEKNISFDDVGILRSPATVVQRAVDSSCSSLSYTYVEPTVFFEFALDCCLEATEKGLKNIFVSNGYMSKSVRVKLAPLTTAINIDLKSFSELFYNKVCNAKLGPVLDNILGFKDLGVWVEVTTLIIPGYNDSPEELAQIASFLASIDPALPWHVTGFYPSYRMSAVPPTSADVLFQARAIGLDNGLLHVYTGNRAGGGGENTLCSSCGETVVFRSGYKVIRNSLKDGRCPHCSVPVSGVWS